MSRPGTVAACATLLAALTATAPQAALAQGNPQTVNRTVEKIPNPAPDLRAQAQAALEKQDYKSAVDLLTKYLADAPKDPVGHFQLGYAYTALKQWTQAAAEYKQAIALDPKLAPAQLNLGLVLLRSDPAAAVEPLRQAATLSPNETRPQRLLAMALERSGQPAEAAAAYRTAVKIAPKDFDAHYELARILLSLKQPAQAEPEFRQALALQPKSPDALAGLAESLAEQNKTDEGTKELEAYLAVRPADASARVRLAGILANAGRLDDAMAQLAQVADQGPEAPAAWRLRGEILLAQKNYAAAIDPLEKAAAALPNDADLHADLGQALLNEKKYEAAAKELTRAVTLDPKRVQAWRDLGAARGLTGQWAATLDALAHLEQLEPLVPISWVVRASCYDHLGKLPEAIAAYQKFLVVDGGKLQTEEYQARRRLPVLEDLLRLQKKREASKETMANPLMVWLKLVPALLLLVPPLVSQNPKRLEKVEEEVQHLQEKYDKEKSKDAVHQAKALAKLLPKVVEAAGLRIQAGQVDQAIESLTQCRDEAERVRTHQETDEELPDDRRLTEAARELKLPGRVLLLFGAGGDRDRAKRPLMGEAAGRGADLVVVTSDNPRSEDPQAIVNDILPGVERTGTKFLVEVDRARAIEKILAEAAPGDIVLIAGKGHEAYQVLEDRTIPFDDRQVARQVLRAMGYRLAPPDGGTEAAE